LTSAKASVAAIAIFLSRLFGLIRAALVTNVLGIGFVGDAFAAATKIPNLLQNLLGEGALSAAFIPEYSKNVEDDPVTAGQIAGAIASFLLVITSLLVAIGVFAARPIARCIAWGFDQDRLDLTVQLMRVITIGSGILVMSSWCLGILNSHRKLFLSYIAPVIWNMTQIVVLITVALSHWTQLSQVQALSWALVVGALAQLLIQLPSTLRSNPHIRFNFQWKTVGSRKVIKRLGPAILGRGALQISAFIDLALASLLGVGAAAAMVAAQALFLLPLSLLGTSVAAAELPELSRSKNIQNSTNRISKRLPEMLWIAGAIIALYLVAGKALVDTIFNLGGFRNKIPSDDLTLIAMTLGAYSLAIPALLGSRLLQNLLFSTGDTSTPAKIGIKRLLVSALTGIFLMFQFDQIMIVGNSIIGFGDLSLRFSPIPDAVRLNNELPARLGAVGLALGATCGAWFEFFHLRKIALIKSARKRLTSSNLHLYITPSLIASFTGIGIHQISFQTALVQITVIGSVMLLVHFVTSLAIRTPIALDIGSKVKVHLGFQSKDPPLSPREKEKL
jgi:putative peptidoglycan lipid II flippase